ncbi:MAG: hypothetical protein E4G74_01015 [Erysipelotrichales bacterium]|nr:MAG: hypothetical protein E4G74_01015 [Erysipelotrichales bacterium]
MRRFWKIMVAVALILSVSSAGLYILFQPKKADVVKQTSLKASSLVIKDLETYLLASPGKHYLYFCKSDSSDCEFVKNDLMTKLAKEANIVTFEDIESIDISGLSIDISTNALRNAWGFSHYPAFVAYDSSDKTIIAGNVLEWDKKKPFTMEDIKSWMKSVGIWHAEYTN